MPNQQLLSSASRRRTSSPRLPSVVAYIEEQCSERYMVTLTDRRKLSADDFSRYVGWALHKTNKAFFGSHYSRRKAVFVATYAVQEKTLNDGIHTHIVIGVPVDSLALKPFRPSSLVPEFLVRTWVNAAPTHRRIDGQDWRPVTSLGGAVSYIEKTIWSELDIDQLDLGNTNFPTAYPAPRIAGE